MLNIADTLRTWCREARPFAHAAVIQVSGSAPLPVGTPLAVDADGNVVGSVSGGCVEGAVYELCQQLLELGEPPTRARFGYSAEDSCAVGLTCGELGLLAQRIKSQNPQVNSLQAGFGAGGQGLVVAAEAALTTSTSNLRRRNSPGRPGRRSLDETEYRERRHTHGTGTLAGPATAR